MNVVGYVRVSTEEQQREGVSLEMQTERIRAYCLSQGWTLMRIYKDGGGFRHDAEPHEPARDAYQPKRD